MDVPCIEAEQSDVDIGRRHLRPDSFFTVSVFLLLNGITSTPDELHDRQVFANCVLVLTLPEVCVSTVPESLLSSNQEYVLVLSSPFSDTVSLAVLSSHSMSETLSMVPWDQVARLGHV